MILQKVFYDNDYTDLLTDSSTSIIEIDLNDIYDTNQRPEELINIFINKQKDDLFIILNGNNKCLNSLCKRWDDRIFAFTLINGKAEIIKNLKYNIIQLIVVSDRILDKSIESNLQISRKILINGTIMENNEIEVQENSLIELPFYMIPENSFTPNQNQEEKLKKLIPNDKELLKLLGKENRKKRAIEVHGVLDKSYNQCDFEKIKEWLQR